MIRFPGISSLFVRQNRVIFIVCGVIAFSILCVAQTNAQTIATYSFEDGTAQGWTSFNGASVPINSTLLSEDGSHSLLTTTGATGQGGPSVNVGGVLQAGAKYTITGFVRLTNGESATNANLTIKRTDPSCSGGTCFDTVGTFQVPVNESGWAAIGGSYTVSTTETGVTLYAQLVGATTAQSFYLDDVVITQTAPPPGGTPVATFTWADGGLDGWAPFGSPTLTNAAPPLQDPAGDPNALLTTNRTATFMGPSLNLLSLKLAAGATYQVTAYVLLAAADSSNPTATLSTKTADCATAGAFANLATSGALSSTAWTKVQGTFSFSNLPGPPTSLTLYMQSSSATDSFYLSDVTISEIAPPPPDPSQQDNSGISSTFEDGGLDGWSSHSGQSSVTNADGVSHSGSHSLLTTGRIGNFDGPQVSVSNKMYPGSVYNVGGWIMLTPADGTNHIINVSLQTTLDGVTSFPGVTNFPGVTIPADGAWHQISVNGYNMASSYDQGQAFLYFQTMPPSGSDLVSFYIDDFQLTYVAPPQIQTDIPSIYKTLAQFFPVGAEVDMADVAGPHAQLLTMHFNSITSGNDMKWGSVENTKGSFNYTNADAQAGVAACADMRIRGHNLVWANGSQTPAYATGDGTNSSANQALVTANIQEHIQNEVQHFGSKVYAWDVVNEPLDPSQPDCLVHGPFYKVLGKSYIDIALQAARQYAPAGTKLFINDFSTTDPNRLACLVQVVGDLRARGIPLDGVGHEMHNAINFPSPAAMVNAIDTVANAFPDIEQQVTELDMSVYNAGDTKSNFGNNVPPAVLAEQGWLYKQYFDAFKELSGKLSAVTFWGMADDDTWLDGFPVTRTDYPLPFDHGLQAKPAYWGIVDPTKLPGYGMTFAVVEGAGKADTRTLKVTATNGNVGTAYATTLNGFTLTQTSGPKCTPKVTAGSTPAVLGDLAVGASASASFTLSIVGCNPNAQFTLSVPWSSAVYDTGTFMTNLNFRK
ncbi:MAG TPA: endo-1,4-beta-xylanase [Terracidiphilus sp.]|nr:endo-1,4-beta-xylanase [Terracidiphilus sp.]